MEKNCPLFRGNKSVPEAEDVKPLIKAESYVKEAKVVVGQKRPSPLVRVILQDGEGIHCSRIRFKKEFSES